MEKIDRLAIGLVGVIVVLLLLMVGYFAGYVAGHNKVIQDILHFEQEMTEVMAV